MRQARLSDELRKLHPLPRVETGIGDFDASVPSFQDEMKKQLKVKEVSMWKEGNPSYTGELMSDGEHGCSASHYLIYEEIARQNLSAALVIEDDIQFEPGFMESTSRALSHLSDLQGGPGQWDILYLDWITPEDWIPAYDTDHVLATEKFSFDKGLAGVSCDGGTSAYIISRRGVQKLLTIKETYFAHLIPIDDFLMSLSSPMCDQERYGQAAKFFADAAMSSPYHVLEAFSTLKRIAYQTTKSGTSDYSGEAC